MSAQDEVAELQANLDEYRTQLQQLEDLLLDDESNEEYQALYAEVREAIQLTEEALAEFQASVADLPGDAVRPEVGRKRKSRFGPSEPSTSAPSVSSGALPSQVLDQIKSAKARSALEGRAPMAWAVGFQCLARHADGQWRPARIVALTADGQYQVQWTHVASSPEPVHRADVRAPDSAEYKGVKAPTRKAVVEVSKDAYERYLKGDTSAIPHYMRIKDTDSAKTKERKQKALKAFKKKLRFERKDLESTKHANDWKAFMQGKGKKKKAGFMTGTKKESMFAVPDNPDGKVGVVGSGRGMTDAPARRTRLDF